MKGSSRKGQPRWTGTFAFTGVLVVAAVVFYRPLLTWFGGEASGNGTGPTSVSPAAAATPAKADPESGNPEAVHHYTCSMHPSVKQQAPGKCPICGMDLIPVTNAQQEQGIVLVDEARRQLIGVRTGKVVEAPMQRSFRAVGRVAYDESAMADVTLKVRGWITELFASQTGQHIRRGQPLFRVYSPELYSAEQDFLLAAQAGPTAPATVGTASNRTELLKGAARQRLHLLGLSDVQIDELSQRGSPSESIEFRSPATGFIIEKNVVQGAAVDAGMRLYRVAGLDQVWVEADVYESDLPEVSVGQAASVTLDYLPGRSYTAKVAYIYPSLDPMARTVRVRLVLRNDKLELRPGMYANVTLGSSVRLRAQVPASAVVYTGPRRLVFVDLGEGRFRPQEVKLGSEANGRYEVLSGLSPGDQVATSGVFLIAAEARISTAAKYWDKAQDSEDGPSDMSAPERPTPGHSVNEPTPADVHASGRAIIQGARAVPTSPTTAFTCPMHPEVHSNAPGKCPKCGMNLVEVPGADPK